MGKLKLKSVKITFKDSIIKAFGGCDTVDHIETKMSYDGKKFIIEIYHDPLDNEMKRVETIVFKADEILFIDQRWV